MISKFAAALLIISPPTFALAQTTQIVTKTDPTTGKTTEIDTTTSAGPAATQGAIGLGTSIIPGSGITPATSLSGAAGTEESALLENVAIREAVVKLSSQSTIASHKRVLMIVSAQTPDTSAWASFSNQVDVLEQSLSDDISDLDKLDNVLKATKTGLDQKRRLHAFAFLPALAVALPVAQKILSYFNTTYSAGGVALTADDYLVEVAMLRKEPDWLIFGQNTGANAAVTAEPFFRLRDKIKATKAKLAEVQKDLDPADQDGTAKLTLSQTAVNADIKAVSDFITAAMAPASMSTILQSELYSEALNDPNRGVLYLKMHSASGGVLTRTTFWSNLGIGMPISNSIDLKISYVFYVGQTRTASGDFDVATRNLPADKIIDFVVAYDHQKCGTGQMDKDLAKACPVTLGLD